MKRHLGKALAALLALVMVVALLPATAFAEGVPGNVQVSGVTGGGTEESPWEVDNGKEFMDLLEALYEDDFNNGPMVYIKLSGTVDTSDYEGKGSYSNLSDMPVIYAAAQIELADNATLTVANYLLPYFGLRITGKGMINTKSTGHHYAIWAYDDLQLYNCELNLDDDKIWMNYPDADDDGNPTDTGYDCIIKNSNITSSNAEIFQLAHHSTLTMESGSITSTAPAGDSLKGVITLENDGTNFGEPGQNAADSTVTINGGTITTNNVAVYVNNDGGTAATKCFTMNGGEIKLGDDAQTPAVVLGNCAGEMTSGTITGGGKAEKYSVVLAGMTAYGSSDPLSVDFTMTGGSIEAKNATGSALGSFDKSTVTVKGGTLTSLEAAAYCAEESNLTIADGSALSGKYGVVAKGGTVDITGGTITATEDGVYAEKTEKDATVTISGGSVKGDGTGVTAMAGASVEIKGSADVDGRFGAIPYGSSKITVSGGTVHGSTAGVGTNGNADNAQASITVSGGKITGDTAGAYLPAGTMTVSGEAEITGKAGIVARGGTLTVESGTITATGTEDVQIGDAKDANGEYVKLPAAAVVMDDAQYAGEATAKTELKGGEFKAQSGDAVVRTEKGEKITENVTNEKFDVSGGQFSSPVDEQYLDASLKAELKSSDPDTPYSYYPTTTEALENSKPGDEVNAIPEDGGEKTPVIYYTVTIKYDNDKTPDESVNIEAGKNYFFNVDDPTKDGYTFNGWLGDDEVTYTKGDSIKIGGDLVITAQWKVYVPAPPTYTTSVTKPANGSVKVSPARAFAGNRVTVTVTPDEGYVLDTLTVTQKGTGKAVAVTKNSNGTYSFVMPEGGVTVNATFKVKTPFTNPFTDVSSSSRYYDAIMWAVENDITTGATDTTFNPGGNCTRAQIVTFLWRAYGEQEPKSMASPFTDVTDSGSPYYKAILWAVEKGITKGATETTFNPSGTCTRAQAVTFQYRAANEPVVTGGSTFTDVPAGAYYADAVAWALQNEITEGYGNGLFGSGDNCTRAQIVTFLYRDLAE